MGFDLNATVKIQGSERTPEPISLTTFGVWQGKEICSYKCLSGTLEDIRGQFRGMEKGGKSEKPMTFSVYSNDKQKELFNNLKGKKLEIRVFITQTEPRAEWQLFFQGVTIRLPKTEVKKFPGNAQRVDLRFDAIYKKFTDDPNKENS